jgi:hypothetical protein
VCVIDGTKIISGRETKRERGKIRKEREPIEFFELLCKSRRPAALVIKWLFLAFEKKTVKKSITFFLSNK